MGVPNTEPIFTLTPRAQSVQLTAATSSNRSDGTGTLGADMFEAFTAASNGSYAKEMRIKIASSAASTAFVANVIRVYLSTAAQSTGTTLTSSDTRLLTEVAIPALTAGATAAATPDFIVPLNFALPTLSHLIVGAGSSWTPGPIFHVTTFGGDY